MHLYNSSVRWLAGLVVAVGSLFLASCRQTGKGPDLLSNNSLVITSSTSFTSYPNADTIKIETSASPLDFNCIHGDRWMKIDHPGEMFRDEQGGKLAYVQTYNANTGESIPVPLRDSPESPSQWIYFPVQGRYILTFSDGYWEVDTLGS